MLTDKKGKRDASSAYYLSRLKWRYAIRVIASVAIIFSFLGSLLSKSAVDSVRYELVDIQNSIFRLFAKATGKVIEYKESIFHSGYKNYQELEQENIKLRYEVARLAQIISESESACKIQDLVKKNHKSIVGLVVSIMSNSYNSSVIINIGKQDGVEKDDFVINEHGLIGRISDVSECWSNVVLITDINSHIPVKFVDSGNMAVVHGTNNGQIEVSMKNGDYNIKSGDRVVTSGYGGLYAEGIDVGLVNDHGLIDPCFKKEHLRLICVVGHMPY